jgi:hypothetical protein
LDECAAQRNVCLLLCLWAASGDPDALFGLADAALAGLALVDNEVEGGRGVVADDAGEQGVGLAAMVGLVVEEMV